MTHALNRMERRTLDLTPRLGFVVVAGLWLTFGIALAVDPGVLDQLWRSVRGLWLPVEALVWVLFLPWVLGLWIWQVAWPAGERLLMEAGLAVATLMIFLAQEPGDA
jgi:hypothetical protein